MNFSHLNDQEIKALLMQYDSELRKLNFQIQVIQSTIQKLHEQLGSSENLNLAPKIQESLTEQKLTKSEQVTVVEPKIISGVEYPKKRPAKLTEEKSLTKNSKKVKKTKEKPQKRKYTKNSPWPAFIIESLKKYGHVLSSAQIYDLAEEENKLKAYGMDEAEIRSVVARTLHQLANVKNVLSKFPLDKGRGYSYALPDWLNDAGELKIEFMA